MEFLQWSCQDVAQWIEFIGYQQYKVCFTENCITGRKLIYVNCIYLPRLGITDFTHMKGISAHVRELLGITEPLCSRSIADPPRDPMGLFLEKKSQTGERADTLTYKDFLHAGINDNTEGCGQFRNPSTSDIIDGESKLIEPSSS